MVSVRPPSEEPHGTVAVFADLYGTLWDLIQPKQDLEDQLVVAPVEIFGTQAIGDGIPGAVVEQQAAQDGLLGFERIRRHAQGRRFVTDVRARLPAESAAGA